MSELPVGHGQPPVSTRFQKGRSGNPKGRPRGRSRTIPFEAVLGQQVTIREEGKERRVTAAEAFLLHLARKGLEGDSTAARLALAVLDEARARQVLPEAPDSVRIIMNCVSPDRVNIALEPLGMARKLDRYGPGVRMLLEPWIVAAALARLPAPLTPAEQAIVLAVTRTPRKVRWPDWWMVHPEEG